MRLISASSLASFDNSGRESEGFIVLFEVLGQHNPALREGTLLCVRFQRVEDQEIAEMPVTPIKISTLQRKLYAKAKQEPGYRFYALYDEVYRADLLQHEALALF